MVKLPEYGDSVDYSEIVVTTIKCDEIGGKKVRFYEDTPTGSNVRWLRNVRAVKKPEYYYFSWSGPGWQGRYEYEAELLTMDEAVDHIKKLMGLKEKKENPDEEEYSTNKTPLFCVHGFNNEPNWVLNLVKNSLGDFNKYPDGYFPIPVLWATEGMGRKYETDQQNNSPAAGKLLEHFVNAFPNDKIPRKSLMMHSMGNHVVFNGACGQGQPDVHFENIFMVAADVPHDIFYKDPNEDYNFSNKHYFRNKKLKADRFMNMLKKGEDGEKVGKVHVLYNDWDGALIGSSWGANWETRLGQDGAKNLGRTRTNMVSLIANRDCSAGPHPDTVNHGYQFEDWAILYYSQNRVIF